MRRPRRLRILIVDDDPGLRLLLRTTLAGAEVELEEATGGREALARIAARVPDLLVLDVQMPDIDGLELCARLKRDARTASVPVLLLTGSESSEDEARGAGAHAYLRKPFSPLELLAVVERLAGSGFGVPFRALPADRPGDALLLYARDLRHVLELERTQRAALRSAYVETIVALASALESKEPGTGAHSQRVQRYAGVIAERVDERLTGDPSCEYGFLLHDVGKIGIPDSILLKPGPLTPAELRQIQQHTLLGERMLGGVASLQGCGLRVVRSHHERWDGGGYPDGLAGESIPLEARIFAVADALDAMTSDRPYRRALPWEAACAEIERQAGRQFDPAVVARFREAQPALREIRREFAAAA